MSLALILLLAYLIPLVVIQIIIILEKKNLHNDVLLQLTMISAIPIFNGIFLASILGMYLNQLLTKKDKK